MAVVEFIFSAPVGEERTDERFEALGELGYDEDVIVKTRRGKLILQIEIPDGESTRDTERKAEEVAEEIVERVADMELIDYTIDP